MKKGFLTVLLSILAGGLTAYGVVKANEKNLSPVRVEGENGSVEYRTVNLADSDYPDFTYAAESAVQAVVYVEVTVQQTARRSIDPFEYFFGFGDGYGFGQPQSREAKGSGSGVIIRPDGYIVTNNHVVSGATKISVTTNDNQKFDATVVGTDPATDVAIIKVDAQNLPTIPMGDSDQLRLGEWVLAIGSPLGEQLRSTITAGIVSAKGRSMPDGSGEFKIESFIQTDAAVNPGNSGGALVNKKGELVGINTAIVSQTGSRQLRRRPREQEGRAGGHQHRHRLPDRLLHRLFLRRPGEHRQARRRRPDRLRLRQARHARHHHAARFDP